MNTIVEHINSAGFSFVEFALPMLIQSSVLIAILLLADLLLRKKVKAVFRYWIWMLVLAKLILPTSLSSPLSLGYLFADMLTYQDLAQTTSSLEPIEPAPADTSPGINPIYIQPNAYIPPSVPVIPGVEPAVTEPVSPSAVPVTPLSWQGVVFLVWLAVVIAMGLLLLQRALFVRGLVAQARKASRLMNDAFAYCCACMGVKGKVGLKVSPNATTPSVCGLIRPVLLLQWNLASTLGASRLRTVLMHELAHIKRADLWVNLAQTALQIIYFYNPLLWLANCVIRRIREQAVDEAVLVAMGEKARQYPQTLVDVAKLAFKRPALSLRLIGVVESESALAGRIKHILGRPIPKTARLGLLGLAAVLIIGAVLLPMAKAKKNQKLLRGIDEKLKVTDKAGELTISSLYMPSPNGKDIIEANKVTIYVDVTNNSEKDLYLGLGYYTDSGTIAKVFSPGASSLAQIRRVPANWQGKLEYPIRYRRFAKGGYISITLARCTGKQNIEEKILAFLPPEEEIIYEKKYNIVPIDDTQPDAGVLTDSSFTATLPNGVTVELVGVCEHPSEGKQWWRPDGSSIEAEGFRDYDFDDAIVPEDNQFLRLLALRFDDDVLQNIQFSWVLKDARESRFEPDYTDKERKRLRPIQVIEAAFPKAVQSTNLQLGVATGPWKSVAAGAPATRGAHTLDSITQGDVIYHEAREDNGYIHISATHLLGGDYDCRIVAKGKDGKVYEPSKYSNPGREMRLCKSEFDVPLEQVKWFYLQARPFQWLTFKNVSLKPNFKTDVQVEVEKPTVQGEDDKKRLSFGSVKEFVIYRGVSEQSAIDFDTGTLHSSGDSETPEEFNDWLKSTGVDAVSMYTGIYGLCGFEMVLIPVENEKWNILPKQVIQFLSFGKPGTPANISGKGELPATYVFKTREGGMGVLQILGFTENPNGVKIRYKMIQKPDVQVEGEPMVSKLLTAIQNEKYVYIREPIIQMVEEIGDKEPISFLTEQLKSENRTRRCNAALALELLGDRRGVPTIIKELNDTSYRPIQDTSIRSDSPENLKRKFEKRQIIQDRYYAALLLGILGDERAVPALIEATWDETINYRAAMSLGEIGDKRAVPALRAMLERINKPSQRLWAGYGLAMLGDEEGLKVVIDTLSNHQLQWTVRRHAIEALGKLADKQAVPHLIGALKDDHPNIRVSAARALGAIGDASALPALEEALKDNTETKVNAPTTVGKAAAEAITQIKAGDGPKTDVPVEVEQSSSESGSGSIVVVSAGKSAMYSSIKEPVDAAPAGSVIRVGPGAGVYGERLELEVEQSSEASEAANSELTVPEAAKTRGGISGVVVSSVTGEPIAGAYVGVGDFGDSSGSNYSRHRSQGFHDKTKTDEKGRFELGGLAFTDDHPYLKYHPLVVTHPDFVRHDEEIELLSSGPVPDVKITLRPAAKIDVTIVDAEGNPLEGHWLIRLEALDGRRFIPPGSDPHLSSFASSIWAHWPDLRAKMGASQGFTFTELDTGQYSVEAIRFHLVDNPTPQNIWVPTITYHGSIPSLEIQASQAKQVQLPPQDHQTRLTITPPEFPDMLLDKLKRSSRMPLMCLISRSPELLLWDDVKIYHLEDQRLGRIDKKRFFRGFFLQGKPLTINNLPPGSYSLFAVAVYGEVAGCLIGARADLAKGDNVTLDIPWRQPTGPSTVGPNRSFDYPVKLEDRDYSLSELCEILTSITQSNPRIIADPSIENEKLRFGKGQMPVWDVLEKLYLDKGWKVDEGEEKTLIIRPGVKTDVKVEVEEREVGPVSFIRAVDNKATLASGVSVELLGLAYIPIKDNPWWKPNGSMLEQPPFDNVSNDPSRDPNHDQFAYYTIAMKLNGKSPDKIGLIKWDFTDAVYAGTTSAYRGEKRVYAEGICAAAGKFPREVETTTLRLGFAAGDWQTLVAGSHYGFYRKGEDSIVVRTPERAGGPFGVRPGEKGLHISVTYNITDRDFRVVAVDKDGKVHFSSRGGSSGTDNLRRTTASFPDLTRDKLQEYRFQLRPHEWVEFKDISLRPGKEAVALTEKRRAAGREELEKWLGQGQTRRIREQILVLRGCRIFKEMETWASAIRELVSIGSSAVPELLAELRRAQRWPAQSTVAFTLRAIADPRAVPVLIEVLGRAEYRGEYGIHLKDPPLSVFMLENQHRPSRYWDGKQKDPQITIGCPVIEITAALEKITGHSEGHEHYGHKAVAELGSDAPRDVINRRIQEIVQEVAGRWQNWWEQNKYKADAQVEMEGASEKVSQFIRADLPASVQNVKFHSGSFAESSKAWIRFDVPLSDLKNLLAESDILPDFPDLHKDPKIWKDMVDAHKGIGIEWWKPDELESPDCSGWVKSNRAKGDPRVWVVNILNICCSQVKNNLMRVYIDFFSHAH